MTLMHDLTTLITFMVSLQNVHVVKAVEGGKQALEVLREEGNNYHLLLVDVLMPDMDGLQLLKIFRQAYSEDMPIISMYFNEYVFVNTLDNNSGFIK